MESDNGLAPVAPDTPTTDSIEPVPVVQEVRRRRFIGSAFYWAIGLAGSTFAAALIASLMGATSAQVFKTEVVVVIAALFYLNGFARLTKEREPKLWQWNVVPEPNGFWTTDKAFDGLRFCLRAMRSSTTVSENVVRLVTRRSKWYVGFTAVPMACLGMLFALLSLGSRGAVRFPYHTDYVPRKHGGGKKADVTYEPVTNYATVHAGDAWIIIGLLLLLGAVFFYYRWCITYYMITNMHLKLIKLPPVWLPFAPSSIKNFKLREIDITENEDSAIGNMLGFGGFSGDTKAQRDDPLKHLRWIPNHNEFNVILEDAAEYAKRNNL